MHSCIYEGRVWHRRNQPVTHQFQKRLFMVYLDLDELPSLVGQHRWIGEHRWSSRAFLRTDHCFCSSRPLQDDVRAWVAQETGYVAEGPIRLLTQLRYVGFYLSPLNLYYLFDRSGQHVQQVVAEVTNTPWNERHRYVLSNENRVADDAYAHAKSFHVSPFMQMELQYHWSLPTPDQELRVGIANVDGTAEVFYAGMHLHRRELSPAALRHMTLHYPLMTAQIFASIYFQALRLWWKRCPFYRHPKKLHRNSNSPQPLHASGKT